ncbi:hypothetical protein [Microvirgula aerodenitrificans]|uniref:hypothetical protein n=1 Tax=Microvirgula aerodenitrificans TaxID=57480 RepID=UPI00248EAC9C|nr:hypothetical protein [Microvirgula aerodenitrificans]
MTKSKDIQGLCKAFARLGQQPVAKIALKSTNPARAAKRLNAHHERFGAGFYPTAVCPRAFGARVRAGLLEITPDFETWLSVDLSIVKFKDHVGRPISI